MVSDTDSSLGVMGVKADWKGYISNPHFLGLYMVIVAELVKRLIVVQEIVGSTPTFHT